MENGITRQTVIGELARSPHRNLEEYLPVGRQAAKYDPEFLAHLIAWNDRKGQIRDSKVALPLIAIEGAILRPDAEFRENGEAHLAKLSPRELLKALRFAKLSKLTGRKQAMEKLVRKYLGSLESNYGRWERTVVRHRKTVEELYVLAHAKPSTSIFGNVLFEGVRVPGSMMASVSQLKAMSPLEAAATIRKFKIPFLVAAPNMGDKLKDKDVLSAIMDNMSPAEITSHVKMFKKYGVSTDPTLRGSLEHNLKRVQGASGPTLKLDLAADLLEDDDPLKERIKEIKEKKLTKISIEGNWLVLADKSSSMAQSMELARQLAGLLARVVAGNVFLVFFNNGPQAYDVTGKTLDQIKSETAKIISGGNTSIGVGVGWANSSKLDVDGIAIVSDGGENCAPLFTDAHRELCKRLDKNVPVYLYHVAGDPNRLATNCAAAGLELTTFPIASNADYHSLPNLVATMRTNRYSLVDEIMETPLLKLSQVLTLKEIAHAG